MKVILHGGTFKTGSTAIQNIAWHNKEKLLNEYGILYPSAGINTQNESIGLRHTPLVYGYGKQGYETLLKALDREIDEAKPTTVLISTEAWSAPGADKSLKNLVDHLNEKGITGISGVFYLRNMYDYMVKHYMEWVRRYQVSLDINSYVIKRRPFFDYMTILKKSSDALKGNIKVHNYGKVNDVAEHVFQQLGVDSNTLSNKTVENNTSLSPLDIELYRIANRYKLAGIGVPSAEALLEQVGLSSNESRFHYKVSEQLFSPYTEEHEKALSTVSGLSLTEVKGLLSHKVYAGTNIDKIMPVLETLYLEWLKSRKA